MHRWRWITATKCLCFANIFGAMHFVCMLTFIYIYAQVCRVLVCFTPTKPSSKCARKIAHRICAHQTIFLWRTNKKWKTIASINGCCSNLKFMCMPIAVCDVYERILFFIFIIIISSMRSYLCDSLCVCASYFVCICILNISKTKKTSKRKWWKKNEISSKKFVWLIVVFGNSIVGIKFWVAHFVLSDRNKKHLYLYCVRTEY